MRPAALFLCLAPVLAGAVVLGTRGALALAHPGTSFAVALGGVAWCVALVVAAKIRDSRAVVLGIAVGAVVLRLACLASEPELSDDLHRYVWEGALVGAGVDPYAHAPSDAELAAYQERWSSTYARVNHPTTAAAYPPLAQAVNAALVALGGGAEQPARAQLFLRVFYATCDLLTCVPLAWLLHRRGRPLALLVAWAWNPWVAVEFAGGGHLDALAISTTVLALACLPASSAEHAPARRGALASALLAAGAATKLLPAVLLPFALRATRRPALVLAVALASLVACVAPYWWLAGDLPRTGGLAEYAFRWESFNLCYRVIEGFFARFHAYDESSADPRRLARTFVVAVWIGLALHAWVRRFPPERAARLLFAGFLVLTPALHPWYLAWIVPFLALTPTFAWSALVAAAPVLYWPVARWRAERVWVEPPWLFPAVAGGFWALLVVDVVVARRRALRARRSR